MDSQKLITKRAWEELTPRSQGYVTYMQSAHPGSELKDVTCPYPIGSNSAKEYAAGEFDAMISVQDSEE